MQGEWIKRIAKLDEALAALPDGLRAERIERASGDLKIATNTLYRQLRAWRYAAFHARQLAIPIEEVHGSFASFEALRRIERYDLLRAEELTRDVIFGRITQLEILSVLKTYIKKGQSFSPLTIIELANLTPYAFSSVSPKGLSSISDIGRFLKVDAEIDYNNGSNGAIFLPQAINAMPERDFYEISLSFYAALTFYSCTVICCTDAEFESLRKIIKRSNIAETKWRWVGVDR